MNGFKRENFYLITSLVLIGIVILMVVTNGKMGNDEGIWTYMARVWIEHDLQPYQNAIDDKPAGILLINALSYNLFGINYWFPRILAGFAILATSFLLYRLNKTCFFPKSGYIALFIFPFTMLWDMINGAVIAQTETFMALFSVLAFFFWFRPPMQNFTLNNILIGICFGFAVSFKQIAGLSLMALLVVMLQQNRNLRSWIKQSLLIGVPLVITFGLLQLPLVHSYSALQNFIHFVWQNPNYYPTFFWRIPNFLEVFWNSKFMLFYPFLIAVGFWFWKKNQPSSYLKVLWIWLFFTFIGANLSGYYYGHQLTPMLPAISLLSGIGIAHGIQKTKIRIKPAILMVILLFLPFPVIIHNVASILETKQPLSTSITAHVKGNSQAKAIGKLIRERTSKNDHVFYFGHRTNPILSYSHRLSASPYFNTIFICDSTIQKQVVEDLKTKRPKFIIKDKKDSEQSLIQSHLDANYHHYKEFRHWNLYQVSQ